MPLHKYLAGYVATPTAKGPDHGEDCLHQPDLREANGLKSPRVMDTDRGD